MMKFKLLNESMDVDDFDLIGKAFGDSTFRNASDSIETDNDSELSDWVWDRCAKGNFVETKNIVTGEYHRYRPIEISENAIDTDDLLIEMYLDDEEIPQLEEDDYDDILGKVQDSLRNDYSGVGVYGDVYTVDGEYGETYEAYIPNEKIFDEIDDWFDYEIDDKLITNVAEFIIRTVTEQGTCETADDKRYYYNMNKGMEFNEEASGDELETQKALDSSNTNANIADADIIVDEDDNVIVLDEANSQQYKKTQKKELARQRQALINQMKDTQTKFKELSNKLNSLDIDNINTSTDDTDTEDSADNSDSDENSSKYKSQKNVTDTSAKKLLTAKNWYDVYKKSGKDFKRMQDDLEQYSPEEQEYIKRYIAMLNKSPEERLKYERALRHSSRGHQGDFRRSGDSIGRKINALSNGFRYGLSKGGIHII